MDRSKSLNALLAFLFILTYSCSSLAQDLMTIKSGNNIQGLSSPSPGSFYTLEHDKNSDAVSIYINAKNYRQLVLKSTDIGHQGFDVKLNKEQSISFIATSSKKSNEALFFVFDGKGNFMEKKVNFFSDFPFKSNDTMPSFSPDGKTLVVRGRLDYRSMIFKTYNFKDIENKIKDSKSSTLDLSTDYHHKWNLPPSTLSDDEGKLRPLQAISSDNDRIYLLFGDAELNQKSIITYSFDGKMITTDSKVEVGKEHCNNFPRKCFYEPEGIATLENNKLAILFNIGLGIKKENFIVIYNKE